MAPNIPPPTLPASHPLVAELTSLRQQVAQYRTSAHQAGISIQGVRLELELSREEVASLKSKNQALKEEVEVLRTTPDPPNTAPPSNALAELSLAHRRLSAKLDFTEQQLSSATLELASTRQELGRIQKERDHERAQLVELRRIEDDREEEVAWERSERKRFEEQKKLCDLALAEYAALVKRLDPSAVPPSTPRKKSSSNILQVQPELSPGPPKLPPKDGEDVKEADDAKDSKATSTKTESDKETEADTTEKSEKAEAVTTEKSAKAGTSDAAGSEAKIVAALDEEVDDEDDIDELDFLSFGGSKDGKESKRSSSPTKMPTASRQGSSDILTSSDAISNLILGQRGVQRLFRDFSSTLTAKEAEIRQLQLRAEELENLLKVTKEQLESETQQHAEAANERDRALRDDASAAKVVERYMTFSQKAHETVHGHLGQLRARGSATQASLRAEAQALRRRLHAESERAKQIRAMAEEMADEVGRESAGRRREVVLRLHLIAAEEARAKRTEGWLDRVRRARQQPDTVDAETIGALLDDGVEILSPTPPEAKAAGWGRRLLRKKAPDAPAGPTVEDESLARIFLAEELVKHLAEDLQTETERRMELEKQRVAWLAKEAEEGVPAGQALGSGHSLFDAEDGVKAEDYQDDKEGADEQADEKDGNKSTEDKKDAKSSEADKKDADDASSKKTKKGKKGKKGQSADDKDEVAEKDGDAEKKAADSKETADESPSSPAPSSPELGELTALFKALEDRYTPIQKLLHDQSVSLAAIKSSLPSSSSSASSPTTGTTAPAKRTGFRALVRGRTAQDDLVALLDGLHEVIEDARVDAEIAAADEDRIFHGFAALLDVGASGVVQAASVLKDAKAHTESRTGPNTPIERLDARVGDIEHDLAIIKRTMHESDGMDAPVDETPGASKDRKRQSIWTTLPLKTVTPTLRPTIPLLLPLSESDEEDEPKPNRGPASLLSSVGRSFSSGVVGAPRRVSGLAGGFYRPQKKEDDKEKQSLVEGKSDDDDVE